MKKLLIAIMAGAALCGQAHAAQQLLTGDGTQTWAVQWDIINDNDTELYGWGDHSLAGYLTAEADPTVDTSAEIQAIIGASVYQAYDADLTTYAGITPSANVQTFLGSANYAAMSGLPYEPALGNPATTGFVLSSTDAGVRSWVAAGAGDITGVLGDATGDVPVLYQTYSAFTGSDATPDVSTSSHWKTVDTTTITTFDGTPVDGQHLWVRCDAATVFDLTSSGIVAVNRTSDFTCATNTILHFIYDGTSAKWIATDIPTTADEISTTGLVYYTSGVGFSSVPDEKLQSMVVADLADTATPSVLTAAETTNKVISNYKSSGADHVFTMPAPHAAGNVIFPIGDEFQVDIEPYSGDLFYLNGTAMSADEHIVNAADTLGQRIVGYCVNINGTLRWMFYSSDADFVQATP